MKGDRHPKGRTVWPKALPKALAVEPGASGKALRATRARLGLSMRDLAAHVGRSVWWVHAVEHDALIPQPKQHRMLQRMADRAPHVSY
jgi:DNA-binding transcriptional regulator YiaG